MFAIIVKDNIDKNARSNMGSSHYHVNCKTVMQFRKADIPSDNLAVDPIDEEDGYDLTSILSSYSIVLRVYHCKEPLHPHVLTFQGTVDGSTKFFKQTLIESIDGWRW